MSAAGEGTARSVTGICGPATCGASCGGTAAAKVGDALIAGADAFDGVEICGVRQGLVAAGSTALASTARFWSSPVYDAGITGAGIGEGCVANWAVGAVATSVGGVIGGDVTTVFAGGGGNAKRSELSSAGTLTVRSLLNAKAEDGFAAGVGLGVAAGAVAIVGVAGVVEACAAGSGSPG